MTDPQTPATEAGRKRPWVAIGRSNEREWNGKVGRRFATEQRARDAAAHMTDEGCWDVRVEYWPVR